MKGRKTKTREKRGGIVEQLDIRLKTQFVPTEVVCQCTYTLSFPLAATYGPHVDQAPAQERVQAPVYARQTGDVEDFVTQACR